MKPHTGEAAKALSKAVFIALGDKVAEALRFLAERSALDRGRILDAYPIRPVRTPSASITSSAARAAARFR